MSISNTRFNRFAHVIEARFSAGVWSLTPSDLVLLRLPRLAGVTSARYLLLGAPKVGALGEHAVKTGQVNSGPGHQSDQPGYGRSCASLRPRHTVHPVHNIQWLEYDMGCAVTPG
jgi:hypothetical protein